jgi:hypothetical protein
LIKIRLITKGENIALGMKFNANTTFLSFIVSPFVQGDKRSQPRHQGLSFPEKKILPLIYINKK